MEKQGNSEPGLDVMDLMILRECSGEEYVKWLRLAALVGLPDIIVMHRLDALAVYGYVVSDHWTSSFKLTDKGKAAAQ